MSALAWMDFEQSDLLGVQIRMAIDLGPNVPELVWNLHRDVWADDWDAVGVPDAPGEAESGAEGQRRAVSIYVVRVG